MEKLLKAIKTIQNLAPSNLNGRQLGRVRTYDWCYAIMIYIDDLSRLGDTIMISRQDSLRWKKLA